MKKLALPQCGLPKRVLKHASEKELADARTMVDKIKYRWYVDKADPFFELRRRAAWEASDGLRGFRAIMRRRYANDMSDGVYRTTVKYTPYKKEVCVYGQRISGGLPKGTILTWAYRDEMDQNWFMWKDHIITITGVSLDKVERLE